MLTHVLAGLQGELGIEVGAVHVRHGLVAGSEVWGDICAELCAPLSVPLAVREVQVDRAHPGGLEAAAREVRRAALLDGLGGGVLALAHHRDDQAETVLFRALRGSGVKGLAGMSDFVHVGAGGRIWRPLLDVPRSALHAYAERHGLRWVDDPSNTDTAFSRNFLRKEILPQLNGRFAGASANLARLGRLAGEAEGLLEELADSDLEKLRIPGCMQMLRAPALGLSSARLRNLLRRLLIKAGTPMPDEARLREAERQFREDAAVSGSRILLGEVALCVYRQHWWLEAATVPAEVADFRPWRGEAALPWAGGVLDFCAVSGQGLAADLVMAAPCRVGHRAAGARMRLNAGGASRSLKNLWQEAGIPPWLRDAVPMLWVEERLAWIAGVGVAAEFACPPGAAGILPRWSVFP
ncbi:MAG: tRNA lysidine(34) synthetase TilS [Proteobacteria bacterium]|nr:tRNA lysidine(34) synthetase TilS [Pseudomonadota bacterium]